ncbi:hypothetical protein [Propionicicella superfundia]|uniref:hypothetical protein n=1 Tax=Propionicicella superfundia TaxID=348582 RepID=UPI0003FD68A9|nr:hypothetical protein [Propionicicella superfundia]
MRRHPHLADAVEVFRDLGWEGATLADAARLSTGTAEQRKRAKQGLATGDWGEWGRLSGSSYGWIPAIDVDRDLLGAFAVRVGVDARRAATVMPVGDGALEVLVERGPEFARRFIAAASRSRTRLWEHSATVYGSLTVRLVLHHGLEVPDNIEYLKDWAAFAVAQLTGDAAELPGRDATMPAAEPARERFVEHIDLAVSSGLPSTGPLGRIVPAAVAQGWLDPGHAAELALSGMDAAQRPGDRKRWAEVLVDELAVDPQFLVARSDALIPALATGEAPLVERFGPPLIAGVGDDQLGDIAVVSLMVGTRKGQRTVLKALAARTAPSAETVASVAPRLDELAAEKDRAVSRAAAALLRSWGVAESGRPVGVEQTTRGLWQPTPALWQVPDFEVGEGTPQRLTDLAAELTAAKTYALTLTTERFFACANAVAYDDAEAARAALRGIGSGWRSGLMAAASWVKKERPEAYLDPPPSEDDDWAAWGFDLSVRTYRRRAGTVADPMSARETSIMLRLGEVPCLLSTPSTVSMQVRLGDLVERLRRYVEVGARASEADLLLALLRLDPGENGERVDVDALAVPVLRQHGVLMPRRAGEVLQGYLLSPLVEPEETGEGRNGPPIGLPDSLRDFPQREIGDRYAGPSMMVVPTWGDAALTGLRWSVEGTLEQGVLVRQAARRAAPLPPGGAMNLLAVQRPGCSHDAVLGVQEAWRRGLLIPGVADVGLLDWDRGEPRNVAALVSGLRAVAEDGVLSVVWPILDDLLVAALRQRRMMTGASEVVSAVQDLLPEVTSAVTAGLAPRTALDLPGLRGLALRAGSSAAVRLAGEVVALLPEPRVQVTEPPAPPERELPPFETAWPTGAGTAPGNPDGITAEIGWLNPKAPRRLIRIDLTVPGYEQRFRVLKRGWFYDLTSEGQLSAIPFSPGEDPDEAVRVRSWLHWDDASRTVVVHEHRDWRRGLDGPLEGPPPPVFDAQMLAVLAVSTQDRAQHHGRSTLPWLAGQPRVGSRTVSAAMTSLLGNDAFDPGRLMPILADSVSTLPVLWPVLAESIRFAAGQERVPRWLNRVLEVALEYAPILAEASRRGLLPEPRWPGLAEIAARRGNAVVLQRARALGQQLVA